MEREEMENCLDHFKHTRYDGVTAHFADDVTLQYHNDFAPGAQPGKIIYGKDEFIETCKALHESFDIYPDIEEFISGWKYNTLITRMEFIAKKDAELIDGIVEKGKAAVVDVFVFFDLSFDGKFQNIRIAPYNITYPEGDVRHALK